ncbi:MAG: hypothetical protein J0M05_01045 [Candidatus Kapabacteria bacterium]|nr:hypothetical protein [Candidatus Kapabacteria bacterium]
MRSTTRDVICFDIGTSAWVRPCWYTTTYRKHLSISTYCSACVISTIVIHNITICIRTQCYFCSINLIIGNFSCSHSIICYCWIGISTC